MNLKFEAIVQIFRKIIQLNVVIVLKSTNTIKKLSQKVSENEPLSCYALFLVLTFVVFYHVFRYRFAIVQIKILIDG